MLCLVTSASSSLQLFVLNEAGKHLGVREELQELAHSAGRMTFAEVVSLHLSAPIGELDHVKRVVAHQFHEETHEGLRQQGAQVSLLAWTRHVVQDNEVN